MHVCFRTFIQCVCVCGQVKGWSQPLSNSTSMSSLRSLTLVDPYITFTQAQYKCMLGLSKLKPDVARRFDVGSGHCWCSFVSAFEQKNVFKDHHEKNSIWGKDGFYVLVICLTIFIIIFSCLMVRIYHTVDLNRIRCCGMINGMLFIIWSSQILKLRSFSWNSFIEIERYSDK